jgi:hypothetical protein
MQPDEISDGGMIESNFECALRATDKTVKSLVVFVP